MNGKGKLFRDSKFGNVANGLVVTVLLYLADALASVDLTPLPDAIEPLGVAAVATVVGLLVSRATARREPVSRPSGTEPTTY